jgi:hypothetical protein
MISFAFCSPRVLPSAEEETMTVLAKCPGCGDSKPRTIMLDGRDVLLRKLKNNEEIRGEGLTCGHTIVFGSDVRANLAKALEEGTI